MKNLFDTVERNELILFDEISKRNNLLRKLKKKIGHEIILLPNNIDEEVVSLHKDIYTSTEKCHRLYLSWLSNYRGLKK